MSECSSKGKGDMTVSIVRSRSYRSYLNHTFFGYEFHFGYHSYYFLNNIIALINKQINITFFTNSINQNKPNNHFNNYSYVLNDLMLINLHKM